MMDPVPIRWFSGPKRFMHVYLLQCILEEVQLFINSTDGITGVSTNSQFKFTVKLLIFKPLKVSKIKVKYYNYCSATSLESFDSKFKNHT